MNIESYIRKYGYEPDYSTIDPEMPKYEKALLEYLGKDKYKILEKLRLEPKKTESSIMEFIQNDVNLFRMMLSSQIKISIEILEGIKEIIHKLKIKPQSILELGGAEGWAADYLNDFFKWKIKKTIVDNFQAWKPISKNTEIINKAYHEYKSQGKFDLIISILGANLIHVKELLECIHSNLSERGIAIIGLRISRETEFYQFANLCAESGLEIINENSFRITAINQTLPIISLKKRNITQTKNEMWKSTRECFQEIESPKCFFGVEGFIIYDLISDGKELLIDRREWDNGDFFQIRIVEKNEIVYRIITNSNGDILIETPIELEDDFNNIDDTLYRSSYMPDFWKSSL